MQHILYNLHTIAESLAGARIHPHECGETVSTLSHIAGYMQSCHEEQPDILRKSKTLNVKNRSRRKLC
jgi:hypothetical protein